MNLINREDVIAIVNDSCLDLDNWNDAREFCNEIKELPLAFNGMTNGEVIQALFPNATFKDAFIDTFAEITFVGSGYALLKKEWWNASYQEGGE